MTFAAYKPFSYRLLLFFNYWLLFVNNVNAQYPIRQIVINGHCCIIDSNSSFEKIILSKHLELPRTNDNEQLVHHLAYTLSYNETHEQANWVAYELTKAETAKQVNRSNNFEPDPLVETGSANNQDYIHSGYDRGHLAPAADMAWSAQSMQESFYYSNMSPQNPSFNRGIWKHLEEQVRNWAIEYNTVYVVTGPVLKQGLYTIGPNRVSIPEAYYKVLLRINPTKHELNGIGFILPNEGSKASINSFAVSIDHVEKLTGINFFDKLPDALENELEVNTCLPCWNLNSADSNEKSTFENNKRHNMNQHLGLQGEKVQCAGITQKGLRCKRTTTNANGRCFQH